MGLFDSTSRLATKEYGDLYRDRATRLISETRALINEGHPEEAEGRVRQLIALQEKFVGDRHPEYASGLSLLGEVLTAKDELSDAETVLQRSLEIRKKALGDKHPDYADSLDALGRLSLRFEDYDAAEPLLQKALDVRRVALGIEHPAYAASLVAMADLHRSRDDLHAAELLLRDAIAVQRSSLGDQDPEVGNSLCLLAEVLMADGRVQEAETLLKQAVDLLRTTLGETHPDHLSALSTLTSLYQKTGRLDEAEPLWRLILDMKKQSLGERHPDCAIVQSQLAQLLQKKGDLKGAETLLRQVSESLKNSLGDRHPDYATSLNQLGMVLQRAGDLGGAEPFFRQTLAIRKDVLGTRHPDYGTSLINLAQLVQKRGDSTWAKMLMKEAVEIRRSVCGETHPDYAFALATLADILGQQGETDKAETLLRQTLEIRKKTVGTEHPSYAANLSSLAAQLRKKGDFEGAEELLRQALQCRKLVLGEKHPDYATNLGNLAWLLQRRGDRKGAEKLLCEALEIRRVLFGESHQDYIQNLDRLEKLRAEEQPKVVEKPRPLPPRMMAPPPSPITSIDSYDDPRPSAADSYLAPPLEIRDNLAIHSARQSLVDAIMSPFNADRYKEPTNHALAPPRQAAPEPELPEIDDDALFGGAILAGIKIPEEPPVCSLPEDEAIDSETKDGLLDEHAHAISGDMIEEEGPASDRFAELLASETRAPSQVAEPAHIVAKPDPEVFRQPEPEVSRQPKPEPELEPIPDFKMTWRSEPVSASEHVAEIEHEPVPAFTNDSRISATSSLPEESWITSEDENVIDETPLAVHEPVSQSREIESSRQESAEPAEHATSRATFEFGSSGILGFNEVEEIEEVRSEPEPEIKRSMASIAPIEPIHHVTPVYLAPSSETPVVPAATTARSLSMTQSSSHLSTELAALSDRFSELGERLLAAARQLHAPGVPPAEELIEAVSASRHEFTSLRERALGLAGTLDIHAPSPEHLNSLQAVTGLLDQVAEAELRKSKGEDTKRRAVAVLERVLTLSYAGGAEFEPLHQAHEQARSLRGQIAEGGWGNLHGDAEKLAEGEHHFADLLSLIEDRDELSDDTWATLHESVTRAFGKSLAAAAARSKLVLPANHESDHDNDDHAEVAGSGGQRNHTAYFGSGS